MAMKLPALYQNNSELINRLLIIIIAGFIILFILNYLVTVWRRKSVGPQTRMILRKLINYGGFIIIVLIILQELKISLTAFFGAAGIAAIAISFAAQNSLSNIISGIFLIWEKPFKIGDLVKVNDKSGTIYSMDLLSVNLRTFDNTLIRIPNESLMKATLVNVTRFPIRRLDLSINIAYKDDVEAVFSILKEIAQKNPYCLDEPEPILVFKGFMDSSQEILFGVWFEKSDFLILRNSILKEIKRKFDKEGIEIPFPHRTVYAGTVSEPFLFKSVDNEGKNDKPENS